MAYTTLQAANAGGGRADQLRVLASILAANIDTCDDQHLLAQLSRQYRETIRELATIEPSNSSGTVEGILDGIGKVR